MGSRSYGDWAKRVYLFDRFPMVWMIRIMRHAVEKCRSWNEARTLDEGASRIRSNRVTRSTTQITNEKKAKPIFIRLDASNKFYCTRLINDVYGVFVFLYTNLFKAAGEMLWFEGSNMTTLWTLTSYRYRHRHYGELLRTRSSEGTLEVTFRFSWFETDRLRYFYSFAPSAGQPV